MGKDIKAKIVEIDLVEVTFKRKVRKQSLVTESNFSYEIKGNNVEYDCSFDFKISNLHLKAKYFYEISLNNIDESEIEEFITTEHSEIFYPIYSKMSGLVAKITDEVTPFPFIAPADFWEPDDEEDEEGKDNEKH